MGDLGRASINFNKFTKLHLKTKLGERRNACDFKTKPRVFPFGLENMELFSLVSC